MSLKIALQTIPLILLALLVVAILIPACAPNPNTTQRVGEYNKVLKDTGSTASNRKSAEGLEAFGKFLTKISDKDYVSKNTAVVYAPDAYLNDTLVTHHGAEEIKAYFLATAETMTSYKVTIDDTASSGNEHYVRWTMVFSAPKLNGGEPVESVGMSHVRFNDDGKVVMHQDYWDSGFNIYGQIPVVGGVIETIRRRFEN
jgi:limonene-1,2-epoxide hydrolase